MSISSKSLFHFTPKFEYLRGIIKSGFKFRLCREELPLLGNGSRIIGRPNIVLHIHSPFVICFCDLPLSASKIHRDQYGKYAIAMTKEWGMMNKITPIRYVHSHTPGFTKEAARSALDLQYVRAYEGDWMDRATGQSTHRTFYDEREWRAASPTDDGWIDFKFGDIRHIIVTTNDERKAIGNQLIDASEDLEIGDETRVWGKIHIASEIFGDI